MKKKKGQLTQRIYHYILNDVYPMRFRLLADKVDFSLFSSIRLYLYPAKVKR